MREDSTNMSATTKREAGSVTLLMETEEKVVADDWPWPEDISEEDILYLVVRENSIAYVDSQGNLIAQNDMAGHVRNVVVLRKWGVANRIFERRTGVSIRAVALNPARIKVDSGVAKVLQDWGIIKPYESAIVAERTSPYEWTVSRTSQW